MVMALVQRYERHGDYSTGQAVHGHRHTEEMRLVMDPGHLEDARAVEHHGVYPDGYRKK